nr:retrotransposon protein, putative, Ty1-copia subclass [Tanacetum cinerariifolium]
MKGYIDNLERLGQPVGQNLAVSLILVSLNKDFDSFVQNYNMHDMRKTVNELHDMLKQHEETLPKKDANPALYAIRAGMVQKNQKNKPHKVAKGGHGKSKGKICYAPNNAPFNSKHKTPSPPKKDNPAKDAICHQCALQGLRGSKKLKPGALSLYVGDGHRAAVEAIGNYHLELPSGLVIVLNNCHYAPSITRGVILVLRLFDDGFINRFDDNNVISVSKNNLVYFMAVLRDGIFEIDMSCSNTNDSSIQLRLVLSIEDKENYLEHPIPAAPVAPSGQQELKAMYSKQAEQELLQTMREFHTSKQEEDGQNLAVSLILVSLNKDFDSFVQNYNMHGMGKTEGFRKIKKNKSHKAGKGSHGKGKGKMGNASNNASFASKPKNPPPPKKDNPAKDTICTNVGLRGSKKLKTGALSLYVGDGHRAAVEAIETYHLELPSGLVIVLNNCHYAPYITRGVISVLRLFDDGFINRFDDKNIISVSKNNLVYFKAVPWDGIYEIDMSCSNTNDSSVYAITNKRAKFDLDSSLLWHCHLGHISKKLIEKLQHDGLLNSIDIESLEKCVSCMSGKMARKPYSHQVERAKYLLGLIHTDVFQKEVENQLGKTIKSLRCDRGGEYMSQEFLDHLKEHGIISHRTPP